MRGFADSSGVASESKSDRPWLGVRFTCAGQYVRVYRRPDGSAYDARCPKCGRIIKFRVGQGGSDDRFFEISCDAA
ncbi:MAG: hypothetical protein AAFQ71_00235 [Planctomycetota bacterium]